MDINYNEPQRFNNILLSTDNDTNTNTSSTGATEITATKTTKTATEMVTAEARADNCSGVNRRIKT